MDNTNTARKRPRRNFGKRANTIEPPYLLAIQLDSYRKFIQAGVSADERDDIGLQAAFKSVFPIVGYSGYAQFDYVSYTIGRTCI